MFVKMRSSSLSPPNTLRSGAGGAAAAAWAAPGALVAAAVLKARRTLRGETGAVRSILGNLSIQISFQTDIMNLYMEIKFGRSGLGTQSAQASHARGGC